MALSKKALQQKREKKKKKHTLKIAQSKALNLNYSNWPIFECLVPEEIWERGMGQIIVSRKSSQGDIAVGAYLVDTYCLGLKDCFSRILSSSEYEQLIENCEFSNGEINLVERSYACTLIHKALAYAKQIGFQPHADFSKAKSILTNIAINDAFKFEFGKDGEPFYMQGPYDKPFEVKKIMQILASHPDKGHLQMETQNPELISETE